MRLRALALTVLPLAGISCQLFFGVDDPPAAGLDDAGGGEGASDATGAGGSTAVSSSSTGPPQCDVCLDVPDGWSGPVLRVAEPGKSEPLCPNATIAELAYEGAPGQHTCTPCACGAPSGECGEPTYHCWSAADCTGNALTTTNADSCLPVLLSGNTAASCRVDPAPTPGGGSCPAVPGQVQGGSWQLTHGLCPMTSVPDDSCRDGSCFDTGGSDSAELCVYSSAPDACPEGWDTRYDAWRDAVDGRSCGCTCTPTNEACNGGGYAFGPIVAVCPTSVGPEQCRNDVYAGNKLDYTYAATCQPGPSQASGAFTPSDPVTICCRALGAG
jgi:hypothetical protein